MRVLLESMVWAKSSKPSYDWPPMGELPRVCFAHSSAKCNELVMDVHMDSNIEVAAKYA